MPIDHNEARAAVAHYNECREMLEANGWTPETPSISPFYWWRHASVTGTCSIGAAMRHLHYHQLLDPRDLALEDERLTLHRHFVKRFGVEAEWTAKYAGTALLCAKCDKPVALLETWRDIQNRELVFMLYCHGQSERHTIPMPHQYAPGRDFDRMLAAVVGGAFGEQVADAGAPGGVRDAGTMDRATLPSHHLVQQPRSTT